jgi:hypothetical protein
MQTTGAALVGVQRCSLMRLRATAHDGWSMPGLMPEGRARPLSGPSPEPRLTVARPVRAVQPTGR